MRSRTVAPTARVFASLPSTVSRTQRRAEIAEKHAIEAREEALEAKEEAIKATLEAINAKEKEERQEERLSFFLLPGKFF